MFKVGNRNISMEDNTYIIAELSANHNQDYEQAVKLVQTAKDCGADAVKLQTYTPNTITIDCDSEYFQIGKGTIWEGKNLYQLYGEAYTPWDWQPRLKAAAEELGLGFFSTPFDHSAVDFLEQMDVQAYKIASFEIVDIPMIKRVAQTNKPIIMSTGMATLAEIDEAVQTIRSEGNSQIALLKCTSSYPALPEEMHLKTIAHMQEAFGLPIGLSDHTLGIAVSVAAVALGACIVEKHLTLNRSVPGPDSAFSLEPEEFKQMVEAIRIAEKALGSVSYSLTDQEKASRVFRRSLFIVKDIQAGAMFSEDNVRSIRPAQGIHTRYLDVVVGRKATKNIKRGTPVSWDMFF